MTEQLSDIFAKMMSPRERAVFQLNALIDAAVADPIASGRLAESCCITVLKHFAAIGVPTKTAELVDAMCAENDKALEDFKKQFPS